MARRAHGGSATALLASARARLHALGACAVDIAWRDGRLSVREDGAVRVEQAVADLPALREALPALLAPFAGRRLRVRVGDEHARLMHLPRPEGARTPGELQAAWRGRFERLFGEDASGWRLHASARPWARDDLVVAWPVALEAVIGQAARDARLRCVSMRTDWMDAAMRAPRRGACWVMSLGEQVLVLGWIDEGRVRGVRRLAVPPEGDDLAGVMARAAPLFTQAEPSRGACAPVRLAGRIDRLPTGALGGRVVVDAGEGPVRGAAGLRGLDAVPPRRRAGGVACVAAALVALAVALPRWQDAHRDLERARSARAAREATAMAAAAAASRPRLALSRERLEALDAAAASLDRPWPALMRAIDGARPGDVDVVALQPGEPASRLRLTIESARAASLAEFASRLAGRAPVRAVALRRQERLDGAAPRYRLVLDLEWSRS